MTATLARLIARARGHGGSRIRPRLASRFELGPEAADPALLERQDIPLPPSTRTAAAPAQPQPQHQRGATGFAGLEVLEAAADRASAERPAVFPDTAGPGQRPVADGAATQHEDARRPAPDARAAELPARRSPVEPPRDGRAPVHARPHERPADAAASSSERPPRHAPPAPLLNTGHAARALRPPLSAAAVETMREPDRRLAVPPAPPDIVIEIGRIEVRAAPERTAPVRRTPESTPDPAPAARLSRYLKARGGRP